MKRTNVKSSNIKSVGYDDKTKILEVEFLNKSVYQYLNVPKTVYEGLMKAKSCGKYFSANIRKGFKFVKLPDEEKTKNKS